MFLNKKKNFSFIFSEKENEKRIDIFLKRNLEKKNINISRTFIHKTLNQIKINGIPCSSKNYKLKDKDHITYNMSNPLRDYLNPFSTPAYSLDIPIIYEDEFFFVVDKPANLIVHPSFSHKDWSLLHFVQDKLSNFKDDFLNQFENFNNYDYLNLSNKEKESLSLLRPGLVHRIDYACQGLLIISKTKDVQFKMIQMFKERKIQKTYLSIIKGIPPKKAKWENQIGRRLKNPKKFGIDKGIINPKLAITHFKRLCVFNYPKNPLSLVKIFLITGRTHQIRSHFSHHGFSILGDSLYGRKKHPLEKKDYLALLAYKLKFQHPIHLKEIKLKSSYSEKFCQHFNLK